MKKISMLLVVVLLCTSGCATYRPLVDRPGPDYEQDLRECQEHAEGEAGPGTGAVFGALLGAAFGALVGHKTGFQGDFMRAGMIGGALGGASRAGVDQMSVIKNCMSGRGYSVLR